MKSIYFDIGGVLFKDGMTKFIDIISNKYPIPNEDSFSIYKLAFHKSSNARKLRTGELSLDLFYDIEFENLRKQYSYHLESKISKDELSKLWFNQYEPIIEIRELIFKLKELGCTIGIISANFKERFEYVFSKNNMMDLFDKDHIFLTYNLQLDKKDIRFYEAIAKVVGSSIKESYYIEDAQDYILNAKSAGFDNSFIYDYKKKESANELLSKILK